MRIIWGQDRDNFVIAEQAQSARIANFRGFELVVSFGENDEFILGRFDTAKEAVAELNRLADFLANVTQGQFWVGAAADNEAYEEEMER